MMVVKICLVNPAEIESLHLKCGKCGGATSIPSGKIEREDIVEALTKSCPHCKSSSGFIKNTELEHLANFLEELPALRDALKGKTLEVSFQVKCPE